MPPEVAAAYTAALQTVGNPASQHTPGQQAREQLEAARERIARQLGVTAAEVVFTSGGTESINLALKGLYWQRNRKAVRPVLLVAEGEHHATIDTVQWLAQCQGARVVWLPLATTGVLSPATVTAAIAEHGAANIALLSFLWVNNEIGTVQPVRELTALAKAHDIPTHVDAVAALGQFSLAASGAAALSLSGHKIGAPVSSGALILARDAAVEPLLHGGSQQRARSGTQDVAAVAAFATALELAHNDIAAKQRRLHELQQRLIADISAIDPSAVLRGAEPLSEQRFGMAEIPPRSLANVHFTFPGCQGDSLLFLLDMAGVAVSTGSACTAGVVELSHVMLALGLEPEVAAGALRFTYGANTTDAEVKQLLDALPAALKAARKAGLTLS